MSKKKTAKSTELTENEQFSPTPHMEKWLDTAIELASDSPTEIARASKVTKQSWYKWLKEVEGFEDWYYTEYKRKRNRWIPTLDKIGMKYAERGEYQFWKDMNKKAGENLDNKTPNTAMQINFNKVVATDKDTYDI